MLVDGQRINLAHGPACVLQALVELQAASGPELSKRSGIADAVKVLKRIREGVPALRDHIMLPGGKGKGGYRTTIADAVRDDDQQLPT